MQTSENGMAVIPMEHKSLGTTFQMKNRFFYLPPTEPRSWCSKLSLDVFEVAISFLIDYPWFFGWWHHFGDRFLLFSWQPPVGCNMPKYLNLIRCVIRLGISQHSAAYDLMTGRWSSLQWFEKVLIILFSLAWTSVPLTEFEIIMRQKLSPRCSRLSRSVLDERES